MKTIGNKIALFSAGLCAALVVGGLAVRAQETGPGKHPSIAGIPAGSPVKKLTLSDAEWHKKLTPQQYDVLRQEGTEAAYSGTYWNNHAKGTYVCAACGQPLFSSDTKFESGTGWPSYYQPLTKNAIIEKTDNSLGMTRTEVECARCGSHLGHVFDDGPKPTGLRYCMNSVAMKFIPATTKTK